MNSDRILELTPEQTASILAKLQAFTTDAELIKHCTPRGKGGSVKTGKPQDGVMAFIWRWARFHNGTDVTMPVMIYFDLENGIEALTGLNVSFSRNQPGQKHVLTFLDARADRLVELTGGNKLRGVKRWAPLLGRG
jgi:hypothetical protein